MEIHRFIVLICLLAGTIQSQTTKQEQIIDLSNYGFTAITSSEVPTFIFINNDLLAVNLPISPGKLIYYNLRNGTTIERINTADIAPFLPTRDGKFIRFISHSLVLNEAELQEIASIDIPFAQRFGARSVRVSPGGT